MSETKQPFFYEMMIREHHLDSYGHVNNATFVQILEEARWEAITSTGYGYKEVQKRKVGPVILEINVKFKKELKLREVVRISVEGGPFKGKIATIHQKILKHDGAVASEALITYGMFDLVERKLVDPSPEWLAAFKAPS